MPSVALTPRTPPTPPTVSAAAPTEATDASTRILRVGLAIDESRVFWEHFDPSLSRAALAARAFEQRWFGNKSLHRITFLLRTFSERFAAFPSALAVLRGWRHMDAGTRLLVCHWHVQLSDALYRRFTGELLCERRAARAPKVDRDAALRWVRATYPDRWSDATCVQFASKLLTASSEAGLVSAKRDPRTLHFPKVPDVALAYLLYLLRETRLPVSGAHGTLVDNPYLASVGLTDALLDQRLRALPGITFRRMAGLTEIDWAHADLRSWAEASL